MFRGFRLSNSISVVVYYFIQIIRYMYDHLQAEIYTSDGDGSQMGAWRHDWPSGQSAASSLPLLRSRDTRDAVSSLQTCDPAVANARRLHKLLLISSVTSPCEAQGRESEFSVLSHCLISTPNSAVNSSGCRLNQSHITDIPKLQVDITSA
jgi:hypothetical protein